MKQFPLKYARIAKVNFIAVVIPSVFVAMFSGINKALLFGLALYCGGMLDFTIMYYGMYKAMTKEPSKGLTIMRKGMLQRILAALFMTIIMIKINFMPWSVLIGLLITHVVVLIDSVLWSIKNNK